MDYLLSPEAERRMAEAAAHMPLRAGVATPAGVRRVSDIRAMEVDYAPRGRGDGEDPAVAAAVGGPLDHGSPPARAAASRSVSRRRPSLVPRRGAARRRSSRRSPPGGPQALAAARGARPLALLLRSLALALAVTALSLAAGPAGRARGADGRAGAGLARSPARLSRLLAAVSPRARLVPHPRGPRARGISGHVGLLFSEVGVVLVLPPPSRRSRRPSSPWASRPWTRASKRRPASRPGRCGWSTRILLPAAAPAIALAALTVFSLSLSELGVPMFLRVDTFPAAVFARLGGSTTRRARPSPSCCPSCPWSWLLLACRAAVRGHCARSRCSASGPARASASPWDAGAGRLRPRSGSGPLLSSTPVAALVARAASGGGFAEAGDWLVPAPWNSLGRRRSRRRSSSRSASSSATARRGAPRRAILDAAASSRSSRPPRSSGSGSCGLWNRPGLQWVYGSAGILVVGYVARYAVIGRADDRRARGADPVHVEEAAAAVGRGLRAAALPDPLAAPRSRHRLRLAPGPRLLPARPGAAVLYYPAGGEPLTVRIFTLEANGPEPVVAALAVAHVAMTAAVVGGGGFLVRRRWREHGPRPRPGLALATGTTASSTTSTCGWPRRESGPPGALGLRKDLGPPGGARPRRAADRDRAPGGARRLARRPRAGPARGPRPRRGVPGPRALAAPDGRGQPRLRPLRPRRAGPRSAARHRGDAAPGRARRRRAAPPGRAVGRSAAAGRDRACPGAGARAPCCSTSPSPTWTWT